MPSTEYTYVFEDTDQRSGMLHVVNHHTARHFDVCVGVNDGALIYDAFDAGSTLAADLVDFGLAVFAADRLSAHFRQQTRCINISLPVRNPDHFNQGRVVEGLASTLAYFTGDRWNVSFRPRVARRAVERQGAVPYLVPSSDTVEVALWSGGLDAYAGLHLRYWTNPHGRYVMMGTGPNSMIHRRQQQLMDDARQTLSNSISLVQVPLILKGSSPIRQGYPQRSRGFVFLLLGVACALLEGQHTLHIYENGTGAINLPYRRNEVGLDHSRAVDPLALIEMGNLVSSILMTPFTFHNPFLYWTKGEMVTTLVQGVEAARVLDSISCDSRQRRPGQPIQCGRCSSCLLRRQALAVAGVIDTSYAFNEPDGIRTRPFLRAMLDQVETLRTCFAASDPWQQLQQRYPKLTTIAERVAKHEQVTSSEVGTALTRLYQQYMAEWEQIQHLFVAQHMPAYSQLPDHYDHGKVHLDAIEYSRYH